MANKYEKLNKHLIDLSVCAAPHGYLPNGVRGSIEGVLEALIELMPDYANTTTEFSRKLAERIAPK